MCTIEQHPGKFEGETCITHLMYAWAMEGMLQDEDCACEPDDSEDNMDGCGCTPVSYATGPFTLDDIRQYQSDPHPYEEKAFCDECTKDFLAAWRIRFWEDSFGFAYSRMITMQKSQFAYICTICSEWVHNNNRTTHEQRDAAREQFRLATIAAQEHLLAQADVKHG